MMTWFVQILAVVAVALGVTYLGAAYAASLWLTRAARGGPARTPADFGLTWEPFACFAADGVRLAGWVVAPAAPVGTVALFHGVHAGREQTLGHVRFLAPAGYRCVAIDHRAHGESGGRHTSFGYHEARDVAAVLAEVRRRWPDGPLAVLAVSMGAAAVCYAADAVRGCDAVILEGLYHDIDTAFANRLRDGYPLQFRLLAPGLLRLTEARLGLRRSWLRPSEHIGRLAPTAVLLLTGENDKRATPDEARRLFERCGEPRQLWVVPGAGHGDLCESGGESYRQRVLTFFGRWMRRPIPGACPFIPPV